MSDSPVYNLDCQKCQVQYKLDDVAFDKSCQNKHIFLFVCPKCGDYKGTAMVNIPQAQWAELLLTSPFFTKSRYHEAKGAQDNCFASKVVN